MLTIEELKYKKESEDRIEFKKGENGNISYDGGSKIKPSERRRVFLVMSPHYVMKEEEV